MIDAAQPRVPATENVSPGDWDVVVVGAGPAGSTAARILADRGHAVLLLDKAPFPREKVCGDGLIPDALRCLERAGLYEAVVRRGQRTDMLSVFSPSGIQVDLTCEFVALRRQILDEILMQSAVQSGATFQVAKVESVCSSRLGDVALRLVDHPEPVHARIAVVATGADVSLLARRALTLRPRPSGVALRCYVRSPMSVDRFVVSFDRTIIPGYAWIFPLGDHEYNIGCGMFYQEKGRGNVNLRRTFETFTTRFPLARDLWQARVTATQLAGGRLRCGLESRAAYDGGGVVSIGEAISTTLPYTGEGIGKAMETAEVAAMHIDEALRTADFGALAAIPQVLDARFAHRYAGYRVAQRWLGNRWAADLLARRVRSQDRLLRAAVAVVAETSDPRALFSWRVFLPALPTLRRHRTQPQL